MGDLQPPQEPGSRRSSSRRGSLMEYFRKAGGKTSTKDLHKSEEGLVFERVCVDIADKRILCNVSGKTQPGQVLALMGPSGSGKTTLLNALGGYRALSSGSIRLDGQKMSKRVKRNVSYVLQEDIFFPNLTLRETLRYSALLRLPRELSFKEKLAKVESVIEQLRLQDCANTIVGNATVRGLSGGEKKRTNIGCELLTNPALLLLDEPTSGLDSTSAHLLLQLLKSLATDENKTVVMSVHQPSSQMYHMFDGLMLMAKGKVAYTGPASEAMAYFASLGHHCTLHYNPADYMIELVSEDETRRALIGDDPCEDGPVIKHPWWAFWRRMRQQGEQPGDKLCSIEQAREEGPAKSVDNKDVEILAYAGSPKALHRSSPPAITATNAITTIPEEGREEEGEGEGDSSSATSDDGSASSDSAGPVSSRFKERKWPTPWHWQFLVLTLRTFRQSRHFILSKLSLIQNIILSVICSLVWFQLPDTEESITDRVGFIFFIVTYWGFTPLFYGLLAFPTEDVVISKERSSGSYHLSAYYLAKLISELPLLFFQPTFFLIITYWSAGLQGAGGFFGTLFIMYLTAFLAQGLGLLIGASLKSFDRALTTAAIVMLFFMLVAGFFAPNLPFWLRWVEKISFITYCFEALIILEFPEHHIFSCATEASAVLSCNVTASAVGNATFRGTEVLGLLGVDHPFYLNVVVLVIFAIAYRILAYMALRFLYRPK